MLAFLLLGAIAASAFETRPGTRSVAFREPLIDGAFLEPHPVVVAADRPVCQLFGNAQEDSGIEGQDGSHTVAAGGVVYWNFGDTILSDGSMNPNGVAWTSEADASDCLSLEPLVADAKAAPLLSRDGNELTVWPLGMETTAWSKVHFYYASVAPDPETAWRVEGVGIGSFNTETLKAQRAHDGELIWQGEDPQPSRTLSEGHFIYVFLTAMREAWTADTILARVPTDRIEEPSAYQYWISSTDRASGEWVSGLWDAGSQSWRRELHDVEPLWRQPGSHNGVEVAYNEFLGQWVAVYTTGFMTSVSARTSDSLTGPWDDKETVLVDCLAMHPPPNDDFVCYTGAQHEIYARDGGRTIYISYANGDAYQVYLHEVRLAAPVAEQRDEAGRPVYVVADQHGLSGNEERPAFYASDIAAPGLVPIHRWTNTDSGAIRYGPRAPYPVESHADLGIAFYAAEDAEDAAATNALYSPVYRWTNGDWERYSPLDLRLAGYTPQETAFYTPCPDADSDSLSDCFESFLGTNGLAQDSDGDGLNDGYEHSTEGCDPLAASDDQDSIGWLEELKSGSNPCLQDQASSHVEALAGPQFVRARF